MVSDEFGSIGIIGARHRGRYADLNLEKFLKLTKGLKKIENLHSYKVAIYDSTERNLLRKWSIYKGLVGSIESDGSRYALNEGRWYKIDNAVRDEANLCFAAINTGLDGSFPNFPKSSNEDVDGKIIESYQREFDYNKSVCDASNGRMILLDTDLVPVSGDGGRGLEVCDILDLKEKKLIHVKKSGRRSSVISHFLNQGMISSKMLKTNPTFKILFLEKIKSLVPKDDFYDVDKSFPEKWSVEFKFADTPNRAGNYTIPFFSRIALNEIKNEIEALGFNKVSVSFIGMD